MMVMNTMIVMVMKVMVMKGDDVGGDGELGVNQVHHTHSAVYAKHNQHQEEKNSPANGSR